MSNFNQLFEPRYKFESLDGYNVRINTLTKSYQKLEGFQQQLIHAAKEDGFYWRGDDMADFHRFYDEFMKIKGWSTNQKREYYLSLVDAMPDRSIK